LNVLVETTEDGLKSMIAATNRQAVDSVDQVAGDRAPVLDPAYGLQQRGQG
jgi:hypothetical protein